MIDHTAMLNAAVDAVYKRAMNHNKFSVDPEAVLYLVCGDVKHDFEKIDWQDKVRRPPLEIRTAIHEFKHRILALKHRERNAPEIEEIAEKLLVERKDPQHYFTWGRKWQTKVTKDVLRKNLKIALARFMPSMNLPPKKK